MRVVSGPASAQGSESQVPVGVAQGSEEEAWQGASYLTWVWLWGRGPGRGGETREPQNSRRRQEMTSAGRGTGGGGLATGDLVHRCGGNLLPGVRKTKAPRWASARQAAGHGVRPQHGHKVHGAQQQRAHLLVLLQHLAQVPQLLRQLPDLPPQHCVFLLQALIFLGRTGERAASFLKTHRLPLSWQMSPAW